MITAAPVGGWLCRTMTFLSSPKCIPSLETHLFLQATPQPGIAVMCIWTLRDMWDPSWVLHEISRHKLPTYMSVDSWSTEVASSPRE